MLLERGAERNRFADALARHWPEYLMEAAGLGTLLLCAGIFTIVLQYSASPVHQLLPDATLRRVLMGLAMGITSVAIVYSPWGRQSGAHMNPALTLTFFRLRRVEPPDALFYVIAQFIGALAGVLLVVLVAGRPFADPAVSYAVTVPGVAGQLTAFAAELAISFGLMTAVLLSTNTPRLAPFTGVFAGALIALYIAIEAPLSGMSMNPARTLGSALPAREWTGIWIYFTAPPLGMLLAAEAYVRLPGKRGVRSAKLVHDNRKRCIFRCDYHDGKPLHT
jgi:aquaporin Z